MSITKAVRLLSSICEMCFLYACFSTNRLHTFIDASFVDKKSLYETKLSLLVADVEDSLLSLLRVDVEDPPYVVSSRSGDSASCVDRRCRTPTFSCLQSMSSLMLNLKLILYNEFTTQSPKHMHAPSQISASNC